MPTATLRVIDAPAPGRRIVLQRGGPPLLRREGDTDYRCGGCETVLVEQAWQWEIQNVVLRCPSCGAFNEVAR